MAFLLWHGLGTWDIVFLGSHGMHHDLKLIPAVQMKVMFASSDRSCHLPLAMNCAPLLTSFVGNATVVSLCHYPSAFGPNMTAILRQRRHGIVSDVVIGWRQRGSTTTIIMYQSSTTVTPTHSGLFSTKCKHPI